MKKIASGIFPIIVIDRDAPTALHRQIYERYRTAIVEGKLLPNQRIPSSRALAAELGVSRFPVLNAYDQLLAEGYIESRIGVGMVVSNSIPDQITSTLPSCPMSQVACSGPRPIARRSSILPRFEKPPWLRGSGAFRVAQVASDEFPLHIWSRLVARRCRSMDAQSFHYSDPLGSMVIREAIMSYLRTARSLRCQAEQIMMVSGSQQALELTARVLLDPGSQMWIEEPGYSMARDVLTLAGCHLIPVPVDTEGMDVAAGIALCARARAAFVTPSHQFPLGVTMSVSRRLRLLDWAQSIGSWIIEDDYDSEYRYQSMPIASLQGLDANGRVIYIGTFSKVLFPSLRLGYIVIPADLVDRFRTIRRVMDLGPPNFYQDVVADFMNEGHFARHIRRMRMLYRERRSSLVKSIQQELGDTVEILGDEAGMHLTIRLRSRTCDLEVADRAARQNLWLWPLSCAFAGTAHGQGFILGFGGTPTTEIPGAVKKLRNLLTTK
jgi:GntR family transcriptional regulator / MocR family aminotransferase